MQRRPHAAGLSPRAASYGGSPGSRDLRGCWDAAAPAPRLSKRETAVSSGVRHSVSTKILVERVTVRTRSTFPLAIQL